MRSKIVGTSERPRLIVFRSSKHIYAQLIDDLAGVDPGGRQQPAARRRGAATAATSRPPQVVGKKIAEVAKAKGITKAAFDRGHYRYHGRIKALADAAREGGLQF